jgi:hypothetical protein
MGVATAKAAGVKTIIACSGPFRGGPMHRCPRLEWRTWLRLALIPAGGDWRSLAELDFEALRVEPWHGGVLGVQAWGSLSGTVSAGGRATQGTFSVADPRPGNTQAGGARYNDVVRVVRWDGPAGAVTSGAGPSSGGQACARAKPAHPASRDRQRQRRAIVGMPP